MRVVLYLRYSSDKQQETSIEGQREVCTKYCSQNGHDIVGEYADRAVSAYKKSTVRANFMRMIKDSAAHTFDAVLVYKLDRFARNRADNFLYKKMLSDNGVKLLSACENIDDDKIESILLEGLLVSINEYYSAELAQKVQRGMGIAFEAGRYMGGVIPYGYKVNKYKEFEIESKEAEIIKEVFNRYAAGELLNDIVADLNGRGLRNRQGKLFETKSFQTALKNKRYIGTYTFGEKVRENAVPAIIDKETFDKVQDQKENMAVRSGQRGKKMAVKYRLSGIAYCGCGALLKGHTGKGYHYYRCPNQCGMRLVGKDELERIVLDDAFELLTDENIERISTKAEAVQDGPDPNIEIAEARKTINKLEADNDRLVDLILDDKILPETAKKKMEANVAQVRQLEARIDELMELRPRIQAPDFSEYLYAIKELKESAPNFTDAFLSAMVKQVIVNKEEIHIIYKIAKADGTDSAVCLLPQMVGYHGQETYLQVINRMPYLVHTIKRGPLARA